MLSSSSRVASTTCFYCSSRLISAGLSPGCGPYHPNWAWLPPTITNHLVVEGKSAPDVGILPGVTSPSLVADMETTLRSLSERSLPESGGPKD